MSEAKHKRIRRVEKAISQLVRMDLIYKLGGAREANGIGSPTGGGVAWTDCSGFVLYLLAVAGIKPRSPAGWTGTLVEEGREGWSSYLTLLLKEPEQTEGHVILRLRKRPRPWHLGEPRYRWAECGGRDNPRSGGGPTWFKPTPERIAEFPYHRHFKAL
ncbi:MAG: hypothetical protein QOF85_965 [Solirubrobacterales bacterium]|jgi:hypothetical protein|nr:hypothetical protein [Solirubrobacterales bacterium]